MDWHENRASPVAPDCRGLRWQARKSFPPRDARAGQVRHSQEADTHEGRAFSSVLDRVGGPSYVRKSLSRQDSLARHSRCVLGPPCVTLTARGSEGQVGKQPRRRCEVSKFPDSSREGTNMRRARGYVWLVVGVVWLVPALVLAQNAPGPRVRAQSPQAAAPGVNAATADQIRLEIQQKLAEVAKAKAAEQTDQARIQQLSRELQTLRAQLRQGAGASAQLGSGPCPMGGPGLGLGYGRGPGFAAGAANQGAGAGFGNQGGPPGWASGRGPCGQGLGPCGGACWNCPYGQSAPPANMGAGSGRGGRGGGGRGYRGGR